MAVTTEQLTQLRTVVSSAFDAADHQSVIDNTVFVSLVGNLDRMKHTIQRDLDNIYREEPI